MRLTVGTYNLQNGGDGGRLGDQLDLLAVQEPDLLAIQEAKHWDRDGRKMLHWAADALGMTFRDLVTSNHHGCHLALFVRERDGLRVVQERHDPGPPFWHALGVVELQIPGRERPLFFINAHLAPGNPDLRTIEAQTLKLFRGRDVILAGDINGVALGEKPSTEGVDPDHAADKLDARPALALRKAGLLDVAACWGDPTPTVGHTRADRLAYRCDQIHTTLPRSGIRGYGVVEEDEPLSDHRPVVAEFDLGT